MVKVLIGNIFESKAQTIVNTVNCVGVMGKGIALESKNRFPDMYKDYLERCKKGEVKLGQPYLYRRVIPPWIINFPTKDHWRSVARIDVIERGLLYLLDHYKEWGITSLAVPPLGCGEGQLEWRVVGRTLYRYLSQLDIPVELYAPYGTPIDEIQSTFLSRAEGFDLVALISQSSRIEPGLLALVEILNRIEQEPYHWPIGRTTFQKIAYFATEIGLPTGLTYIKGSYGPYAPKLKAKITKLVNHGLIREEPIGGNMLAVKVGPTYRDAQQSYQAELTSFKDCINRVSDLFLRIRLTKNAEAAATIHFSAKMLSGELKKKPTEKQLLAYVINWKQRRRPPMNIQEIAESIRNLAALDWLKVESSDDLPVQEEAILEV